MWICHPGVSRRTQKGAKRSQVVGPLVPALTVWHDGKNEGFETNRPGLDSRQPSNEPGSPVHASVQGVQGSPQDPWQVVVWHGWLWPWPWFGHAGPSFSPEFLRRDERFCLREQWREAASYMKGRMRSPGAPKRPLSWLAGRRPPENIYGMKKRGSWRAGLRAEYGREGAGPGGWRRRQPVSQTKTCALWCCLYVKSKKRHMKLFTKQRQTHRQRKQTEGYTKGGRMTGEGSIRSLGLADTQYCIHTTNHRGPTG